ncbi:MAG: hypothetical protein II998_11650 [Clostridia bacterium]|nr:hypothetical protein [Clostridia bacterium]
MAWYDEAIFYHIYPLGMTGAPKQNTYGNPEHRLNTLIPFIPKIKELGCDVTPKSLTFWGHINKSLVETRPF